MTKQNRGILGMDSNTNARDDGVFSRIKNYLYYNAWIILLDILAFNASYLLALVGRFFIAGEFRGGVQYYLEYFWQYAPIYTVLAFAVFVLFRLYGGMWQYAGLHDFNRIVTANLVTAVLQIAVSVIAIMMIPEKVRQTSRMPFSYYIIGALLQFSMTAFSRFFNRFWQELQRKQGKKDAVAAMLVGTGETGRIVRKQMEEDPDSAVRIDCIFSYRDAENGSVIDGVPIVRHLEQLQRHFDKYHVRRVILADPLLPMNVREQIKACCQENDIDVQDFSGFLRYDSSGLPFQKLMECVSGKVAILQDGKITRYNNGEQAVMSIAGKHDVKAISIQDDCIFVELISYHVDPLIVFYITNRPDVALVAEKYGVDRIWVDLEQRGKEERQRNLNTVKSNHKISDIAEIKPLLTKAEMLVRVNSWYEGSQDEIDAVIAAGADIVMLPYWKTADEVKSFLDAVHGRCKTTLLLETKEAVDCIDDVLKIGGFDEIHIGLNDLHLSYGMSFMFELLSDGTVEMLCRKFKQAGVPFGFGGIAKLGSGMLPAERIIMEHYRLGSTRAILSRSFCDCSKIDSIEEIDSIFRDNMERLREYELSMANTTSEEFIRNKVEIVKAVDEISERIRYARSNGL